MAKNSMGASLYVPCTHKDLLKIANAEKLTQLRSVIFCTEDAVSDRDLRHALVNLGDTLQNMHREGPLDRFVRVRNPEVLAHVLAMPGSEKLAGFVIPKATRYNFDQYFKLVKHTEHMLMPTLETAEVFHDWEMRQFRNLLSAPSVIGRILALRIGGNDLLALLGIRRPRNMTIYRTPLGPVIARLAITFRPYGFHLTAPVFEHLDNRSLLDEEVVEDLAYGMVGKTAIHPDQVPLIEQHYRVLPRDIEVAERIVAENSPAVFKMGNSMCEVATHRSWAENVIRQAQQFGTHPAETSLARLCPFEGQGRKRKPEWIVTD